MSGLCATAESTDGGWTPDDRRKYAASLTDAEDVSFARLLEVRLRKKEANATYQVASDALRAVWVAGTVPTPEIHALIETKMVTCIAYMKARTAYTKALAKHMEDVDSCDEFVNALMKMSGE
jgi:hypothetical protein